MIKTLYRPGTSWLHHAAAGAKLATLAVLAVSVAVFPSAQAVVVCGGMVAAAWITADLGWRLLIDALRPMAIFLLVIFLFQAVVVSFATALAVVAKILIVVLAATAASVTTPVSAMLDALERLLAPLRPVGVNAEQISFMIVLAVRFVPSTFRIAAEVLEAQKARGLERNLVAGVVPMLIRTLREADAVAEALAARGWTPR